MALVCGTLQLRPHRGPLRGLGGYGARGRQVAHLRGNRSGSAIGSAILHSARVGNLKIDWVYPKTFIGSTCVAV